MLLFVLIIATYSLSMWTKCEVCPAGYRCPQHKTKELCPFDSSSGYFYSTNLSEYQVIVHLTRVHISGEDTPIIR